MPTLVSQVFRVKRLIYGRQAVRRTQVYCVGTAKSGTHSIWAMFSRNVRAAHEPQSLQLIEKYFDHQAGRISQDQLREWVLMRDQSLALEVDSSWFNILMLELLVAEFPQARFILTIRDCYSWLNSEFKRALHAPSTRLLRVKLREHIYGNNGRPYAPEERVLQQAGLYPVDGYLARWAAHNEQVLSLVPSPRLLIVRTPEIRQQAQAIADFAGLPRHSVRAERTHEYRNPQTRHIIRELDRNFLEPKVKQHCQRLMNRFFPEIKSLDDARL